MPFLNKILTTDSNGDIIGSYDTSLLDSIGSSIKPTSYRFDQAAPANVWDIVHGLNTYPSVVVVDGMGEKIIGDIEYINLMELKITFSTPISGTAFCN